MDQQDQPLSLTSPKKARAIRLKIHDPGVSCREDVVFRPEFPAPEVAPCQINGRLCQLRDWTEAEWERIPARLRPQNAFRGDRGSWYTIDPES